MAYEVFDGKRMINVDAENHMDAAWKAIPLTVGRVLEVTNPTGRSKFYLIRNERAISISQRVAMKEDLKGSRDVD